MLIIKKSQRAGRAQPFAKYISETNAMTTAVIECLRDTRGAIFVDHMHTLPVKYTECTYYWCKTDSYHNFNNHSVYIVLFGELSGWSFFYCYKTKHKELDYNDDDLVYRYW